MVDWAIDPYLMRSPRLFVFLFALTFAACQPRTTPLVEAPALPTERAQPSPTPLPVPVSLVSPPSAPSQLTPAGLQLIYEYETGGQRQYERSPHPEFENDRFSGVTVGIGYDLHQYRATVIVSDWTPVLPSPAPARLSSCQPYSGPAARAAWLRVRDILVP